MEILFNADNKRDVWHEIDLNENKIYRITKFTSKVETVFQEDLVAVCSLII